MKFFSGLIVAITLTAVIGFIFVELLDWHVKRVVVADLQEITNPPSSDAL